MCNKTPSRGFTLIELLVVISIIALLSAIVFSALTKARSKARDARRNSDMHQIQTALEFYLDEHNGSYPATPASQKIADVGGIGKVASSTDPLTGQSYKYVAVAGNNQVCTSEPCMGYALIVNKENPESTNTGIAIRDVSGAVVATSSASNVVAVNVAYAPIATLGGTALLYTNLSGATDSYRYYTFAVPSNAGRVTFTTTGGTGDVDLYVQAGADPTLDTYDTSTSCSSAGPTNEESCYINVISTDALHVLVYGSAAYASTTLSATFTLNNTSLVAGLGGALTNVALPGFREQSWSSVACSASICAAVGSSPTTQPVMTSANGTGSWTARTVSGAQGWNGVAYGAGTFVAVSSTGPNYSMTSSDGINWTMGNLSSGSWTHVIWTGSQFVALNSNRNSSYAIATSANGINWTTRSTPSIPTTGATWKDIAYNGSIYVVVSSDETTSDIITSPDGVTWTSRVTPANGMTTVAYGNGKFIAIGQNHAFFSPVTTSSDGITWTSNGNASYGIWNSIIYAGGQFVTVGFPLGIPSDKTVMTSPNGTTWTPQTTGSNGGIYLNSIVYNGGKYITVGGQSSGSNALNSSDGVNWTNAATPRATIWNHITKANNLYIANGWYGEIATSPDGYNWTMQNSPAVHAIGFTGEPVWDRIVYGNGLYVMLVSSSNLDGNNLLTSPDAVNWTKRAMPSSKTGGSLIYAGGQFIASGSGYMLTSADGLTWNIRTTGLAGRDWAGIAYGGGKYVSVAYQMNTPTSQDAATSPDGITWTPQSIPSSYYWSSVVHNGTFFTATSLGSPSTMSTSTNGVAWSPLTTLPYWLGGDIAVKDSVELFNAGGDSAGFSADGKTWTQWYLNFNSIDKVLDSNGMGGYRAIFMTQQGDLYLSH